MVKPKDDEQQQAEQDGDRVSGQAAIYRLDLLVEQQRNDHCRPI
jgi:hypothetical protein